MQRSDLTEEETSQSPDETADGVAQFEFRDLGESFTIGYNDDANIAEKLN